MGHRSPPQITPFSTNRLDFFFFLHAALPLDLSAQTSQLDAPHNKANAQTPLNNQPKGHTMAAQTKFSQRSSLLPKLLLLFIFSITPFSSAFADAIPPTIPNYPPTRPAPTTPPIKPCLTPTQQQQLNQSRQNSRCGVFFSPSLPAIQISPAFDRAEQSYSAYKNYLTTSSSSLNKAALQQRETLFTQAMQAYQPFENHQHIDLRAAANMRIGDLYLLQKTSYCESIPQMLPSFQQQAEQSVHNILGETLRKRGVPERFISTLSKRFLSKPQGQQMLSCIVKKAHLTFELQINQNATPLTQKALQYYKLALSLLEQSSPSFPSRIQYLQNRIKSLENKP